VTIFECDNITNKASAQSYYCILNKAMDTEFVS